MTIWREVQPDFDSLLRRARAIGEDHGKDAAEAWLAEGIISTPDMAAYYLDAGLADPDEILFLPKPDLSGEWAASMTPHRLAEVVGYPEFSEVFPSEDAAWSEVAEYEGGISELCDEYEAGFDGVVQTLLMEYAKGVAA